MNLILINFNCYKYNLDGQKGEDEPALLGVVLDQRIEGRVDVRGRSRAMVSGKLLLPGGRPLAHRVISGRRGPTGHARRPVIPLLYDNENMTLICVQSYSFDQHYGK